MTDIDQPRVALPAPDDASMAVFRQLLVNTLISVVTSSFLWFALTFWVFLQTESVVATAMIAAAYSLATAVLSPFFGTLVDRHRKHRVFAAATLTSFACFATASALYVALDTDELLNMRSPWFWMLIAFTLLGSVSSMMRNIALSTTVTLLVPADRRDRANGMVGTVTGVSFAITSVFSGLIIGFAGMGWAYGVATALTLLTLAHLGTFTIAEPEPERPAPGAPRPKRIDVRGALEAIRAVPGLFLLILVAAFNNLLGGVFMALMDPYGLSLVSVQTWGLLFGFVSLAFIAGGLFVARFGLGASPLRLIIVLNLVNWVVCTLFTVRSSVVPLVVGLVIWLALMPAIEAAEQTVLQRAVPFERQGRVFGFAQLVENAGAPVTAVLVAPIAETVFIPFMTDGRGADWIGSWFGTGEARGLALMFTISGMIGIVFTLAAWASPAYRRLSASQATRTPVAAGEP